MLAPSVLDLQNSGPHLQEFSSKKKKNNQCCPGWRCLRRKVQLALGAGVAEVTGGTCGCSLVSFDFMTRVGGEFLGPGG